MAKTFIQRYFPGLSRNTFLTQTLHASGSIVGLVDGFAQAAQNIVQGIPGQFLTGCESANPSRSPAISWRRLPSR